MLTECSFRCVFTIPLPLISMHNYMYSVHICSPFNQHLGSLSATNIKYYYVAILTGSWSGVSLICNTILILMANIL